MQYALAEQKLPSLEVFSWDNIPQYVPSYRPGESNTPRNGYYYQHSQHSYQLTSQAPTYMFRSVGLNMNQA